MIIGVCGLGYTGSGAVIDLLTSFGDSRGSAYILEKTLYFHLDRLGIMYLQYDLGNY